MARSRPSTTPQPSNVVRATRATRATRSRSRELGTPLLDEPRVSRSQKGGTASRAIQLEVQDLATVVEQQDEADGEAEDAYGAISDDEIGSDYESDENVIDPEEALLDLPLLYRTVDGILTVFGQEPIGNMQASLENAGSRLNRKVNDYRLPFESGLKTFGVEDMNGFIRPETVHAAIFHFHKEPPVTSRTQDWRLDDIIFKINLACFAWQLREWADGATEKTWKELVALDSTFPGFFLASSVSSESDEQILSRPGSSQILEATFDLALEIRTQVAIMSLGRGQLDHSELPQKLREVFCDEEAEASGSEILANNIRTWETDELGANLPTKLAHSVLRRIQNIEFRFPDEDFQGKDDYLTKLQQEFPWSDFILKALLWIRTRSEEVSRSIDHHGGSDHILALIASLRETLRAEQVLAEDQMAPGDESEAKGAERLHLEHLEKANPQKQTLTTNRAGKRPLRGSRDQGNGSQEIEQNLEEVNAIQAYEKTMAITEKENQRQSGSSARRNIMDTQPDAESVPWDDTQSSQPRQEGNHRKRRAVDDEVSQDVGFQNGVKRARFASDTEPASTFPYTESEYEQNAEVVGELATAQSTMAKRAISQHRSATARRGRIPWSARETSELIQLIEEYGTSWTLIKEMDNQRSQLLTERDQVALKDKARNIKFSTLKSGSALFRNFESVTLTASMKRQLDSLRIDYEGLPT